MKENIQINKSRDGRWDTAMTCLALEFDLTGACGNEDTKDMHTKKAGIRWTVYSDGNTQAPQKLYTAEGGNKFITYSWMRRRISRSWEESLQESSLRPESSISGRSCSSYFLHTLSTSDLGPGEDLAIATGLRHWGLWQVHNTDSLKTSSIPHRTL